MCLCRREEKKKDEREKLARVFMKDGKMRCLSNELSISFPFLVDAPCCDAGRANVCETGVVRHLQLHFSSFQPGQAIFGDTFHHSVFFLIVLFFFCLAKTNDCVCLMRSADPPFFNFATFRSVPSFVLFTASD